ncbi:MAG: hypothetical protein JW727_01370 [Candidatus Aenigmarchaeota archaeon]|nr:hypothetical protein [Candidatus Aenigmarchaeota archaeon]
MVEAENLVSDAKSLIGDVARGFRNETPGGKAEYAAAATALVGAPYSFMGLSDVALTGTSTLPYYDPVLALTNICMIYILYRHWKREGLEGFNIAPKSAGPRPYSSDLAALPIVPEVAALSGVPV